MADLQSRLRDRLRPWLIAILWLLFAALFRAALAATPHNAEPAPETPPVALVTPFSAGSGPDQVARTMAAVWMQRTGEPVVVRNLPDRQGYAASRQVAMAAPDGRTLLLTSSPLLERPPRLADDPFAPPAASAADFTPLARVGLHPFVTVFPPGMFGEWLAPMKSPLTSPAALRALTGPAPRRVEPMFPQSLTSLDNPPDSEDFKDLVARDVPTWNALLAPPRLPEALAARLREQWRQVIDDPRVRIALAQTGTELWEIIPKEAP